MANKNPFEIRADLLILAQTICFQRWQHLKEERPELEAPTSEEIIAEAEKLNKFVSDNNK